MQHLDVVIVGAGAAGLSAAEMLRDAGCRMAILEARKRVGGRIHTIHDPASAEPAELGAEFVHGRPPEILNLVQNSSLSLEELEGEQVCFEGDAFVACEDAVTQTAELLRDADQQPDRSFEELLRTSNLDRTARVRARAYVEGFNAADSVRIGTHGLALQQKAEDEIEGDRIARIQGGMDAVPAVLNTGLEILLNTPVDVVRWRPGAVELWAGRQRFTAHRVIITVPLGVLQGGSLRFEPQPGEVLAAARRLAMGNAARLTLRFDERLWLRNERLSGASFLHAAGELFPTWWPRGPMLTAWAGGTQADRLAKMSRDELASAALDTLAKILSTDRAKLGASVAAVHYHDWRNDPYSCGAYSYIPAGALDAVEKLATALDDTLWFAGEAADNSGHWGTVHGAIRSGRRAAREILESRG